MPNYSKEMENTLENFETISDFYDDTEAMIIRRFCLLNNKLNKDDDIKFHDELQKEFGKFLVDRGNLYIKTSQNQDE